jgi:excisionase family DNA binding protein
MMTPNEIDLLANALAERLAGRIGNDAGDAWIDAHAAAALLGCSVPTIERLTRSGAIPSRKVGRLRRYRRADLMGLNEKGGADHGK